MSLRSQTYVSYKRFLQPVATYSTLVWHNIYSLRVDSCSVVEYNHKLLRQFAHVIACKMLSLCSIYLYKITARLHKQPFQNKVCSLLSTITWLCTLAKLLLCQTVVLYWMAILILLMKMPRKTPGTKTLVPLASLGISKRSYWCYCAAMMPYKL